MTIVSLILGILTGILIGYFFDKRTSRSLYREAGRVSKTMFPTAGIKEHMLKLKQEADEVIASPLDTEEHADCLLIVMSAAFKAGISYDRLITTASIKLEELEKRKWKLEEDGTYQHIPNPIRPL